MEKEKYTFIQDHEKEIRPLIQDQEPLQSVVDDAYVPVERMHSPFLNSMRQKFLSTNAKMRPLMLAASFLNRHNRRLLT